jgi:hypothetical protein
MRSKQWKFGRNRPVMKGTLLFRPEQFFVHISCLLGEGQLKYHACHRLPTILKQWKFGQNRWVKKGTKRGTPWPCATFSEGLVDTGH